MSYKNLSEEARKGLSREVWKDEPAVPCDDIREVAKAMSDICSVPMEVLSKEDWDRAVRSCEVKVMPTVIEGPEFIRDSVELLKEYEMKNCMANPIKPVKQLFTWVTDNLDLIIYGMITVLGAIGVFGVYFDWLKL